MNRLAAPLILLAALAAGCAGKSAPPQWRMDAHDAAERATQAYLSGDSRVAALEWTRARAEVSRTGRPELLARLELMRCAAEVASLQASGCPAFEALRADVHDAELLAYADYLAGHPANAAQLPPAQRAAAAGGEAAIAAMADPLARLVAAGAAVQAGRATPQLLTLAADTASQQGWRRPLLAWLLVGEQRARDAGDAALAQALRRRIAVVESAGAPPGSPAR
ncbi:hypothetical protein [Pulveribacter suum]|uniref:Uncharacterized protein n=1 Tax=Pulveribacter suum TaxID=2116657 RepID=A0A2P1NLN9_9BURK|nr:hypothetical protein [Pulveribacter suum]AVP57971.1 hypothetical protein C7H73_10065 [Pulveribacter suum]